MTYENIAQFGILCVYLSSILPLHSISVLLFENSWLS